MLSREGVTLTEDGQLVQNPDYAGFSFWTEIEERNQKWYLHRLTEAFVDEPPSTPNRALGGILAEEPGLGKTLETIALILLNPAPPEWNPSVSRWDAESRLDIKAVKTSLIVTPPALAGQWKDELEAHAPSLKVLVYDGWTKVPVPMTKEKAEIERFEHKLKTTPSAKPKPKPKKKPTTKLKAKNGEGTSADGNWLEWCEYVHQFDVVITTFPVLRSEVWVARAPPERLRREAAAGGYSSAGRLRSPLVMVEWKRVVMDEVQMVGGGQAAEMVSMIPRLSSFAVSGTPAKSQVADLIHVLRFLRVDDIIGTNRLWNRLLKPGYVREFTKFLQFYGIRTIKSNISDELTIPQQTRYLVPIEMGRVERHVYDQTLETILLDLGLDARGVAANDGWTVDGGLLRSSIRRLRGICTHPQVGQLQKRGDNLMKAGALKTMEAVLEAMADQNWRSVMDAWRNKILALVRFAQLQQQEDDDNGLRYQHMLETLLATEKEMRQQVDEIQAALTLHDEKGKLLKQEAVKHLKAIQESAEGQGEGKEDTAATSGTTTDRKGKGKAKAIADDSEESGDEDEEEDPENLGLPKTPAGDEHRTKRGALSNRLRDAKVLLHRIIFLEGDAYHGLGRGKEEDEKYGEADAIRKDLLKITERNASGALSIVKSNAVRKGLKITRMLVPVPFLAGGGIKSYYLMEEMNSVIEEVLNAQSTLLWDWRDHIINLLSKPVSPGEGDADGQEYQRTLDDQGEAEAYLQAYSALFSDRRLALVNERALLAAHDIREKQTRKTMAAAAARAAAAEEEENHRLQNGITEDVELKPEHEVLHTNLSEKRKEILAKLKSRSVKSVMIDLQNAYANTYPDTNPERKIIADAVDRIRTLLHDQNELHSEVEMDLANLRKAFNQRIVYFRQLQEISDSVMDVDWDGTLQKAMQDCVLERAALETDLQRLKARQRYLGTLTSEKKDKEKDGDNQEDEDQTCVLCRCDFVRGFITHCAHIFCEECMRAWLVRREGKTCPVCRVGIDSRSVQRFTVNPSVAEPPPRPTLQNGEAAPKSHRKLEYNFIDPSVYADIQMMETYGDYGSKIQTLMRHLTYIKAREPGAKSIIFSAWADSLHIVEMALRHNKIPCLRIEQNSKHESAVHKFRTDPDILVLLLHGERENAGLNVICASRVFLLESVVQHSFEVQAIARIDRLGQTKPTEVYCYYAEDTIERNILDLAARKGLSLYTKGNAIGTLNISPFAREGDNKIDEPQKKGQQKGDFIHKVDDMLAILFPHMYEDLEHLLPADAMSVNGDVEMSDAFVEQPLVIPREPETNAVAGPSRF
ncbi:SNF2 family N-terminal domain-containing protein [Panaeolus papilionaceus]|nr:SNF2 family N-terminal domain-containing protein [Panaeolus papilionaceus]